MRPNRLRLRGIAAWFGVVALSLNALAPIHLAFDLAHTLAPARQDTAADHDLVRCLLTILIGHRDNDEEQTPPGDGHHDHGCAVCSAINTLAGFALPPMVPLAIPVSVYEQTPALVDLRLPRAAFLAAYRSRAPPIS